MELVRWNPNRRLQRANERFGSLFDSVFGPGLWADDAQAAAKWYPVVDVYEKEGNYVISAEIPGVDKKDIQIDVKDRVLTLRGERTSETETEEGNYHRKERHYGRFERTFVLPEDVAADKIDASFKDGILHIHIPKPEAVKPKTITVH